MILSTGTNAKLGPKVASYSRPVGPTCPQDCPFLTGVTVDGRVIPAKFRCYAGKVEKFRPSVQKKWAENHVKTVAQWADWSNTLAAEIVKATLVRGHVGGDFL